MNKMCKPVSKSVVDSSFHERTNDALTAAAVASLLYPVTYQGRSEPDGDVPLRWQLAMHDEPRQQRQPGDGDGGGGS